MGNKLLAKMIAKSFKARLNFLLILFLILFIVLIANIVQLQFVKFSSYSAQSKNNQISVSPIVPIRGQIFDRNGVLLAGNRLNYDLYIYPKLVKDVNKTIQIAEQFGNLNERQKKKLIRSFKTKRNYKSFLIKTNLNEIEINKISSLKPIYPEFNIQSNWTRYYPYGEQTAHIIGYVGKITQKEKQKINLANYRGIKIIGKIGIEKVYENILRGKTGLIYSEKNAYGVSVRVLKTVKAIQGDDIFLSIDIRLQGYGASLLRKRRGSIVMLDNKNSGVLAMVSSPSFNSSLFIGGISYKHYNALLKNPNKPLLNRAINGQYPPGSIIKPFVALAGLKNKVIKATEEIFCPGWYRLPNKKGRTFYGWKKVGHGQVNIKKAIVESCDVYFYELSRRLGIDRIHNYLAKFSLGKPTGIDLEYESSGLLPSTDWKKRRFNQHWYLGETLISGIGQGYMLTTPLQAAFSTLILANKGYGAKPKLLFARHNNQDNSTTYEKNPIKNFASSNDNKNYQIVIEAMRDVVQTRKGTAHRIGLGAPASIAGKTGTAQVTKIKRTKKGNPIKEGAKDHAWFIAFTPVINPKITLSVVVENSGGGSSVAAPIARKLIDRYYKLYPLKKINQSDAKKIKQN